MVGAGLGLAGAAESAHAVQVHQQARPQLSPLRHTAAGQEVWSAGSGCPLFVNLVAVACCLWVQLLGMKGADQETNIWKIRLQLMKPVTWIPLIWGGWLGGGGWALETPGGVLAVGALRLVMRL